MKSINEYLNEKKADSFILESFLDNIKQILTKRSKAPQEFIDSVRKSMENLKKTCGVKFREIADKDGYAKAIDELNNDETLSEIYKYGKKKYRFNIAFGEFIDRKSSKIGDDIFDDIKKHFQIEDDVKAYAIFDLMVAFTEAWVKSVNKKSSSSSSYRSSSRSSSSSSNVARYTSIAATTAMMRRR